MASLAEASAQRRFPEQVTALGGWLLEELAPIPATGSTGSDPGHELIDRAVAQDWLIRRLQANRMRTLARAVELMPPARRRRDQTGQIDTEGGDGSDSPTCISSQRLVASRLAPELNCHPHTATTQVQHALGLTRDLPRIMSLFTDGRLDQARAVLVTRKLHQGSEYLPDFAPGGDRWLLTEATVAAQAPTLTPGELEKLIDRLLLQLQPDGGAAAHERARRGRHVRFEALADGMALITALVTADVTQLLHGFLDAAADAARDHAAAEGTPDTRTHDQRCADALAALIQALTDGIPIPLAGDPRIRDAGIRTDTGNDAPSTGAGATRGGSSNGTGSTGSTGKTDGGADPAGAQVPESLLRRLDEHLDAEIACRRQVYESFGFRPVPEGRFPAVWLLSEENRGKGRGTHLNITMTDTALFGLDDTPGHLDGHGPIAAVVARRVGVDPAQVNVIVLPGACAHPQAHTSAEATTDEQPHRPTKNACPAGLDHSLPQTSRYRPGRTLAGLIAALYPICSFPGCTVPAVRCDLDHLKPFESGGPTCLCNIRPACRGHHRLKTFGGWQARPLLPGEPGLLGTTVWIAPDGTEHHSPPPCLPGLPGWTLPSWTQPAAAPPSGFQPFEIEHHNLRSSARPPASSPIPEKQTRIDLMSPAERTARRTRRWQNDLDWWLDRQERLRHPATKQVTTKLVERAWGEPPF